MLTRLTVASGRGLARVSSRLTLARSTTPPTLPRPVPSRSFLWFYDDKEAEKKAKESDSNKNGEKPDSLINSEAENEPVELPKAHFASVHSSFRFFKGAVSTLHQIGSRQQKAVFAYQRPKGAEDTSKAEPFRSAFYDIGFLGERPVPLNTMTDSAVSSNGLGGPVESNVVESSKKPPNLGHSKRNAAGTEQTPAETWVMIQRVRFQPSIENPPNPAMMTYQLLEDTNPPPPALERTLKDQLNTVLGEFISRLPADKAHQLRIFREPDNPLSFSEFVDRCTHFAGNATVTDLQRVVEELDLVKRAELVHKLLLKEIIVIDMARTLDKEAEAKEAKDASESLLREKEKIESQLDKLSESSKLIQKFKQKLADKVVPQYAMDVINEEFERLKATDTSSHEHGTLVDYLSWLTALPWGQFTKDRLDIQNAKETLEAEHYGLDDVKQRILEFIASAKLTGSVQGKILCLTGPPGTGKTSIARSIATTLGRKFYRFSVGGMTDPAEIKGHRRTYVASKAGKFLYGLKLAQSSNPVFLIDEIDKIERDPASALLEALDPEQNKNFLDHYIDIPYDLSQVLFICTSNDHHRISPPLLDRMEVIEIAGYVGQEKFEIARRCLIREELKRVGVPAGKIDITDAALMALIRDYCPEPGVRTLKKHIQRIIARACLLEETTAKNAETVTITEQNLSEFVDEPAPASRRYFVDSIPPGVAVGVAKTSHGGSIQYVESVLWITEGKEEGVEEVGETVEIAAAPKKDKEKSKSSGNGGKLRVTGQTGSVMKESTQVALTFAKNFLANHQPINRFFSNNNVHMHFPEGAMPKDGPSAGITIVTSLLSLALNKPISREIAMTGEITLSGKVLPVGGIKEKAIAAKLQGIDEIILPKQNEAEWGLEIPDFVKENLTVHFVDTYAETFAIVFGSQIDRIPLFDSKIGGDSFILPSKEAKEEKYPPTSRIS